MARPNPTAAVATNRKSFEDLIANLESSIYCNVSGYDAKYFSKSRITPSKLHERPGLEWRRSEIDSHLPIPLQSPLKLLTWLDNFQSQLLVAVHTRFSLCTEGSTHDNDDDDTKLCLVKIPKSSSDISPSDADILVLGVVQTNNDGAILRLCDIARRIFAARPERLLLHAFRIHKTMMEKWTFDRAGAYSSRPFDILKDPQHFMDVIATYMTMDNVALGLNTFVQESDAGRYVGFDNQGQSEGRKFFVERGAFVVQDYLVGTGTTCFKARPADLSDQEVVVKFSWTEDDGSIEPKLIRLAHERDVWGILKLEGYQDLGDTANLRQGLQFDKPYHLSLPGMETNSTKEEGGGLKFENLKLECIVTSPLGRPLTAVSSPIELLTVLRDVVKSLHSLYVRANILHRDVSQANIIIVPRKSNKPDAPTGMLIDLNLALDLSNPPSEREVIGSEGFMGIGILGGDDHTYRHDLESVFYVFLWMAICFPTFEHPPLDSRLHAWLGTEWLAVFRRKKADMQPEEFAVWVKQEVSKPYRGYLPLAESLHEILFPMRNGKIFIGTDHDNGAMETLYRDMVNAFERHMG